MTGFCTQCGGRMGGNDAFCPQCGVAAPSGATVRPSASANISASTATSAVIAPAPAKLHRRWPYWVVVVALAFILGLLLGQHHAAAHAPSCAAGTGGGGGGTGTGHGGGKLGAGDGGQGAGGGGGGGAAGRVPRGGGNVDGDSGTGSLSGGGGGDGDAGSLSGGGGDLEAQANAKKGAANPRPGEDGPDDPGGGKGKLGGDGDTPNGPSGKVTLDNDGSDIATKLASGKMRPGALDDRTGPPDPTATQHVAHDFTYDRTGLPRYGDSVRGVVSAMTEYSDRPNALASSAAIVTDSSFDNVVEWYRTHLPPGWRNQNIGDLQALASALSPQAIAGALGFSANAQGTPATSTAAPAAPPAPRIRISMFSPPPGTPGDLGIMIVQQEGKSVTVLMKTHQG